MWALVSWLAFAAAGLVVADPVSISLQINNDFQIRNEFLEVPFTVHGEVPAGCVACVAVFTAAVAFRNCSHVQPPFPQSEFVKFDYQNIVSSALRLYDGVDNDPKLAAAAVVTEEVVDSRLAATAKQTEVTLWEGEDMVSLHPLSSHMNLTGAWFSFSMRAVLCVCDPPTADPHPPPPSAPRCPLPAPSYLLGPAAVAVLVRPVVSRQRPGHRGALVRLATY